MFRVTIQTLSVAWAPDSAAFIANDRAFSDIETAYIYDVKTLNRVDLGGRVGAADPGVARFLPNGSNSPPSHFHAIRWMDSQHVEVQLNGHMDGAGNGTSVRPGDCFDLRYRVSRKGAVQQLSSRESSLDSKACDTIIE